MTAIRARRLPVHRGPAAWAQVLGAAPVTPPAEGKLTADIVVVGAGFAGMAAARRVVQIDPSTSVIVIDAGAVAEGAAGRNSGFMIDLPHELTSSDYAGVGDDATVTRLNRFAIEFAGDAVTDYGIDPNYFDRAGKVNGAASASSDAANARYAAHLSALGEASERLDAQAMADLTGSTHYLSGLYTPGTVVLQPAGYIRGMAAGLQRDGVRLYENTPMTAMGRQGSGWRVTTPNATIDAGRIIMTVNGHLESFGFAKGRLMQLFLFASMTPDLDAEQLRLLGGADRWGITPSDPMGTTMRRIDTAQGGNRVVTRTCAAMRPNMASTPRDFAHATRVMRKKFEQRYPKLAGLKMEHVWAGHLCLSLNSVSVAGEIERNLFSGCVQNGLGTARGTLTGIAAAEAACGVSSDIGTHFAAEAAPKKLPPKPFRQWGANAIIRAKEWKARAD